MISEFIITGLLQGLVLAFVAFGVMLSFRLLNFADLSSEGSYPIGGIVCAVFLLDGVGPEFAILGGAFAAGLIGVGTAMISMYLRVNTLLAGIIMTTMVYSINLRLLGKPNVGLFDVGSVFLHYDTISDKIFITLVLLLVAASLLYLFLRTERGVCLRAIGFNKAFAVHQGISISKYTILTLFVSNAYCGFAGALMVQIQKYADVGMGICMVIHALAALMIGEALVGTHTLQRQLLAPIVGAFVYQQMQGVVMFLGLAPSDLKILTAAIVLVVLGLRRLSGLNNGSPV